MEKSLTLPEPLSARSDVLTAPGQTNAPLPVVCRQNIFLRRLSYPKPKASTDSRPFLPVNSGGMTELSPAFAETPYNLKKQQKYIL